MNAQLTPAPWSAFTDDSKYPPHTNIVAVVPRTDCVFSLPGHHKDEPNVKLICAAHDLLAACQEFCRKVDAGEARSKSSYKQMAAAIEKATQ